MKNLRLLLILLLSFIMASPVRASFDDMGAGGRGPGMADAYTGVSDDANAMMYNPAGLVNVREGQMTSEYSQFFKGLDDGSSLGTSYLGYAHPLRNGVLGLAYHNFKAANLLSERTIAMSYGWKLKTEPFGWVGNWSAGATLKQLHRQYEPDRFTENALNDGVASGQADPLFAKNGYSSDAFAIDLGTMYEFGPNDKYKAGLVLRNANQPDVSLGGDGDKAPLAVKLGLAMRTAWGLVSSEMRRVRRIAGQSDTEMAVGAERRFLLKDENAFVLRSGYASGSRGFKAFTAGASYKLGRAEFDYAFNFPIGNQSNSDGSHRLGFSYKVGTAVKPGEEPKTEEVPAPEAAASPLPDAPAALTAPVPVTGSTAPANQFDATLRNFGTMLGYYVRRAQAGADAEERRALLNEIKRQYGSSGIDMGYINEELKSVGIDGISNPPSVLPGSHTPLPDTKTAPAKPAPKPAKVSPVKPVPAAPVPSAPPAKAAPKKPAAAQTTPEVERAWDYYRQAVERGITDSERVEILENMLMRFGEKNADKVAKELEKVRRRLE